jgi:hypothetical protein
MPAETMDQPPEDEISADQTPKEADD